MEIPANSHGISFPIREPAASGTAEERQAGETILAAGH